MLRFARLLITSEPSFPVRGELLRRGSRCQLVNREISATSQSDLEMNLGSCGFPSGPAAGPQKSQLERLSGLNYFDLDSSAQEPLKRIDISIFTKKSFGYSGEVLNELLNGMP